MIHIEYYLIVSAIMFFAGIYGFFTDVYKRQILDDIESLPHGILFWRSMTQWIGGLGIIMFTIAAVSYTHLNIKCRAALITDGHVRE